ncbi:uncharacterized protein EV422DRAFT_565648 [Fimicolochytrium jonesii]|uniref:uncharacterized protein n=1 Tax=Fimicolochytrium jonesii TaxID=1396493 RepID=UPI0022FE178F|nr:uncharacterized protein EV422DRAFT_565648 [Fimicolochytrium jonesii]KAI8823731.1 hypothetical protein EV422DRAFT_565648 [Fimicolochytrium jonesii]
MNLPDLLKPAQDGYQMYMRGRRYVDSPTCSVPSPLESVDYYLADGKCHRANSGVIWFTANCTTGIFTQYTDQNCLTTPNATSFRGDSQCIEQYIVNGTTRQFSVFDVGCLDGGALMGMVPQPMSKQSTSSIPSATSSTMPSSGTSNADDAAAEIQGVGDPDSGNTWKIAVGVVIPIVVLGLALAYFVYRRHTRPQSTKATTLPSVVQASTYGPPSVSPVASVIPAERYAHSYAPTDTVHSTAVHTESQMSRSAASPSRVGSPDGSTYSYVSSPPTRHPSLYARNPTLDAPPQYDTLPARTPAEPLQEIAVPSHMTGDKMS